MPSLMKNLAESYSTTKQYSAGDIVLHKNKLYLCIETTGGEFEPSAWEEKYLTDLVKGSMQEDFCGVTVDAGAITSDGEYTYIGIPRKGVYNENSMLRALNSNLGSNLYWNLSAQLGATCSANSEYSDSYKSSNAINGTTHNTWLSYYNPQATSYTGILTIDLKTIKTVNQLFFHATHSYGGTSYSGSVKISVSTDGNNYEEVYSDNIEVLGYTALGTPILATIQKNARYIKIEITSLMGGGIPNIYMTAN